MMRALYVAEKNARYSSIGERLDLRQKQSAQVLVQLRQKLLTWKEQLLPKHPMAEAVNYALGQWEALNVFCSDDAVPIDNNVSEREMKRVCSPMPLPAKLTASTKITFRPIAL